MFRSVFILTALMMISTVAQAAPPTVLSALEKYDKIMGSENFDSVSTMEAHRDDDSVRTYRMKILKAGAEKLRIWFQEPAAVRGQEMLRQGENLWLYMPNLKRSIRLASRDSFQGGDFNNADVLRVNYSADYDGTIQEDPAMPDSWMLELKAKTTDAAYEKIKLWVRRSDGQPLKGEYFTSSGKLLRTAEFSEIKDFGDTTRPTKITMRNAVATKRFSVMTVEKITTKVQPSSSRFIVDDLGR